MPSQHVIQIRFVEISLLEQLFDPHFVLGSPHARGNGNDMNRVRIYSTEWFLAKHDHQARRNLERSVGNLMRFANKGNQNLQAEA